MVVIPTSMLGVLLTTHTYAEVPSPHISYCVFEEDWDLTTLLSTVIGSN